MEGLIIGVSRRFRHAEEEKVYFETVEPILQSFGIVLRCDFASDSEHEINFWMNRMNVILDISDVHLLMDFDRSASTFYELQSSNLCCLYGPSASLVWNFGIIPPIVETPLQAIVYKSESGVPRVSLALGQGNERMSSPADVDIPLGLTAALSGVGKHAQRISFANWYVIANRAVKGLSRTAGQQFCARNNLSRGILEF